MSVLHVVPSLSPTYGGPSLAVHMMCDALIQRGVKVAIATTKADGEGFTGKAVVHSFQRRFEAILPRDFPYSPMLGVWMKLNLKDSDLLHVHTLLQIRRPRPIDRP